MFIPTKHENLRKSTVVVGAEIIAYLKKKKSVNIEELFEIFGHREELPISLPHFYDVLTFLWTIGIIEKAGFQIKLLKS